MLSPVGHSGQDAPAGSGCCCAGRGHSGHVLACGPCLCDTAVPCLGFPIWDRVCQLRAGPRGSGGGSTAEGCPCLGARWLAERSVRGRRGGRVSTEEDMEDVRTNAPQGSGSADWNSG